MPPSITTPAPVLTQSEASALALLRAAIVALPATLYFSVDEDAGQVLFFKRAGNGMSYELDIPLQCMRALRM